MLHITHAYITNNNILYTTMNGASRIILLLLFCDIKQIVYAYAYNYVL